MFSGYDTENCESFLPEELVANASRRGDDYAWRWKDLIHVAEEAEKQEMASGGWRVLFRTPDGECELCWYSFYPEEKRDKESWLQFVKRSWKESRLKWRKLFADKDFIEQGKKAFMLSRDIEAPELHPSDVLWFVLYFKQETSKKLYEVEKQILSEPEDLWPVE